MREGCLAVDAAFCQLVSELCRALRLRWLADGWADIAARYERQRREARQAVTGHGIHWLPEPGDFEAVASDMGIDPAAPMTRDQHAEFARRMDAWIVRRIRERP